MIHLLVAWLVLGFLWRDRPDSGQQSPWSGDYRPTSLGTPTVAGEEVRVYRLASRLGGRLTVSDVVVNLGWTIDDAEALLTSMTDSVRVRMEVTEDGRIWYEFRELARGRELRGKGEEN